MFENKLSHNGIHYTRYIASWRRSGGMIYRGGLFEQWLREVQQLTEEEISDILLLAENGKMELETQASLYMKAHEEEQREEKRLALMGGYFTDSRGAHIDRLKQMVKKAIDGVLKKSE